MMPFFVVNYINSGPFIYLHYIFIYYMINRNYKRGTEFSLQEKGRCDILYLSVL
jgi:hypothetical protein